MRRILSKLALVPAVLLFGGCAIGYNSVLFMTKSNVGIDVDTKPPTAEVSIARREGVIAPSFEKGQTPPVMASFRVDNKGLVGMFTEISSTFAGGDAAATMSKLYGDSTAIVSQDSSLCLTQKPTPTVLGIELSLLGPGEVKPFVFGTDTSLGLKLGWSGLTAQFPDSLKFGYNRTEFALAPVSGSQGCESTGGAANDQYSVKIPSFLATVDNYVNAKGPQDSGIGWLQYFATGKAATNLSLRKDVREVMLARLDPKASPKSQFGPDKYSGCIIKWRDSDREKNNMRLREWMKKNDIPDGITELIYSEDRAMVRAAVIMDIKIPCN